MKLAELVKQGINKVRLPFWDKDAYLQLHITNNGKCGPWAKIYDPHGQKALGVPIGSQKVLILQPEYWEDDRWEAYERHDEV